MMIFMSTIARPAQVIQLFKTQFLSEIYCLLIAFHAALCSYCIEPRLPYALLLLQIYR
jgi:hypothetical protein